MTHDDDSLEGARSVGCAAALLPRISARAITTWFRRQEQAAPNSHERDAPFVLAIGSTLSTRPSGGDPIDKAHHPPPAWFKTRDRSAFQERSSRSLKIDVDAVSQNGEVVPCTLNPAP